VRLSSLRAELDTTQQALRIESSSRDEELEALILKWRAASQDVAEELFASARDKVFRMGGVRAWKERAKKSRERWDGGEDDLATWGQDLDEDELERRKAEILDSIDTDSRAERDGGREDEDDDDQEVCNPTSAALVIHVVIFMESKCRYVRAEISFCDLQSFTMDMMLKSLNIDLDMIGFDKISQGWIKD
jgi:SEL1 protein